MASRAPPSHERATKTKDTQRRRHLSKYQQEAGKYTKVLNICAWDRDESGQLKVFESETAVLEHEASCGERRKQGEWPKGGYTKLASEQQALAQNINESNQIEHDETRDVVRQEAEDLRGLLRQIVEHQDGETNKQRQLEEKKLEVVQAKAKAKAEEREAFEKKVEAGTCTTLEQKELQLKILAEDIRQHKAELALEKARQRAERAPKRTAEASATELAPKRRRKDPKVTAAPKTETQEYKQGDKVTLNSRKNGQDMDASVDENLGNGYYKVLLPARGGEVIRMKLPLRAASSN